MAYPVTIAAHLTETTLNYRRLLMYTQTTRKLNERDEKILQNITLEIKEDVRSGAKTYFGCMGCMIPIAIAIYFQYHDAKYFWVCLICGFIVVAAILGSVFLEGPVKAQEKLRAMEAEHDKTTVLERHVVTPRCFVIIEPHGDDDDEDVTPENALWSTYYFDIGDQGTIVFDPDDTPTPEFPSSDMTIVHILNAAGREVGKRIDCQGDRLTPLAIFRTSKIETTPGIEHFASPASFTVFPENFEEILRQIQSLV